MIDSMHASCRRSPVKNGCTSDDVRIAEDCARLRAQGNVEYNTLYTTRKLCTELRPSSKGLCTALVCNRLITCTILKADVPIEGCGEGPRTRISDVPTAYGTRYTLHALTMIKRAPNPSGIMFELMVRYVKPLDDHYNVVIVLACVLPIVTLHHVHINRKADKCRSISLLTVSSLHNLFTAVAFLPSLFHTPGRNV